MRFDPPIPLSVGNKVLKPRLLPPRRSPEGIASEKIDQELAKSTMDSCTGTIVRLFKEALMIDDVHFMAGLMLRFNHDQKIIDGINILEQALKKSGSETHLSLQPDGSLLVYSDNRTRAFLGLTANPSVLIHPDGQWEIQTDERCSTKNLIDVDELPVSPERAYSALSADMTNSVAAFH